MFRTTIVASSLLLLTGGITQAADPGKKPVTIQATGASQNSPTSTQPQLQLGDDVKRAVSDPSMPAGRSAAVQNQQSATKAGSIPPTMQVPHPMPSAPSNAGVQGLTPSGPGASSAAVADKPGIQAPGLDARQLDRIRQIQETVAAAAVMEQIEDLGELPGRFPDPVTPATPGDESVLGSVGVGRDPDAPVAEDLIRDLWLGRGGVFSEDPSDYIERTGGDDPIFEGPGNRGQLGDGKASQEGFVRGSRWSSSSDTRSSNNGRSRSHTDYYSNGSSRDEEVTVTGDGIFTVREYRSSSGRLYRTTVFFDAGGDGETGPGDSRVDTVTGSNGVTKERICRGGNCGDWHVVSEEESPNDPVEPPTDPEQPSEGGSTVGKPDACNFNPITGKCQGYARATTGEMTGQPSPTGEGDEAGGGSSAPNVGPIAVTNPGIHDGSSSGRTGGGGFRPPGGTPGNPDPPEGEPDDPGGGLHSAAASTAGATATNTVFAATGMTASAPPTDAALDELMGELESPPGAQ